ncbi:MAG TPA: hypothetical protein H9667_09240 [Firmicutes bacterium]|nr:hypothetical protein [Bacillales bacterium]HJA41674.1 hypothetical protein [Bacillota bacterium]
MKREENRLDQEIKKRLQEESIHIPDLVEEKWQQALANLPSKKKPVFSYRKWGASAAAILCIGFGYFVYTNQTVPFAELGDVKERMESIFLNNESKETKTNPKHVEQETPQLAESPIQETKEVLEPENQNVVSQVVKEDQNAVPQTNQSEEDPVQHPKDSAASSTVWVAESSDVSDPEISLPAVGEKTSVQSVEQEMEMIEEASVVSGPEPFHLENIYQQFSNDIYIFAKSHADSIPVEPISYQIQGEGIGMSIETSYAYGEEKDAFLLRQTVIDKTERERLSAQFLFLKNPSGTAFFEPLELEGQVIYIYPEAENSRYAAEMIIGNQWIQLQCVSYDLSQKELSDLVKRLVLSKQHLS